MNQLDLIDIHRLLNPIKVEYTFFSNAHGKIIKMDYILDY